MQLLRPEQIYEQIYRLRCDLEGEPEKIEALCELRDRLDKCQVEAIAEQITRLNKHQRQCVKEYARLLDDGADPRGVDVWLAKKQIQQADMEMQVAITQAHAFAAGCGWLLKGGFVDVDGKPTYRFEIYQLEILTPVWRRNDHHIQMDAGAIAGGAENLYPSGLERENNESLAECLGLES
jgi:hypothetical protein